MAKPSLDNNIQPGDGPVEESVVISIALPHTLKSEIRAAAKRQGLKISQWGKRALIAALATERRSGEDRRHSA